MTPFWGVYPSFWGSNPLGEGVPWKTLLLLKKTPRRGGPVTPFWGSFPGFPYYFWKSTSPNPFLGGTPIFGSKWPIFSGFYWKSWSILEKTLQKPSKNGFFTVNTLIFGKIDPFWGVPPIWGVYTPQKNVKNERFLTAPKVAIGQNRTSLRLTSWNPKVEHFWHEF